jgi:hypothetical protein
MKIKRFKPRQSVKILNKDPESDAAFLKTWALARLLGWSILDQTPRRQRPQASRTSFRSRNARQVGHIILAHLLDQRVDEVHSESRKNDPVLPLMICLVRECGGFSVGLHGPGANILLRKAKKSAIELQYVYLITQFMCRYRKYLPDGDKFQIASAKLFVEQNFLKGPYGPSKISQIWEQYKHAAPYIFAGFSMVRKLSRMKKLEEAVEGLKWVTSNQQRLARFLGVAAHAADILDIQAHNIRVSDFRNITRVAPRLRQFNEVELACINSISRKEAIA